MVWLIIPCVKSQLTSRALSEISALLGSSSFHQANQTLCFVWKTLLLCHNRTMSHAHRGKFDSWSRLMYNSVIQGSLRWNNRKRTSINWLLKHPLQTLIWARSLPSAARGDLFFPFHCIGAEQGSLFFISICYMITGKWSEVDQKWNILCLNHDIWWPQPIIVCASLISHQTKRPRSICELKTVSASSSTSSRWYFFFLDVFPPPPFPPFLSFKSSWWGRDAMPANDFFELQAFLKLQTPLHPPHPFFLLTAFLPSHAYSYAYAHIQYFPSPPSASIMLCDLNTDVPP